jgi:hypothetical protein
MNLMGCRRSAVAPPLSTGTVSSVFETLSTVTARGICLRSRPGIEVENDDIPVNQTSQPSTEDQMAYSNSIRRQLEPKHHSYTGIYGVSGDLRISKKEPNYSRESTSLTVRREGVRLQAL